MMRILSILLTITWLLSACTASPTPVPVQVSTAASSPTPASLFSSSGGGEPRTTGYWLLWNSCAEGNQAETAKANGGREAGWIILDDLLADPGILVGDLQVETCQQGVNLLQGQDLQGNDRQNDPAYTLAAELMTAQLNLAVGSEDCTAANQAVQATQLLLLSLSFNGTQGYLGPPVANQDRETALFLADQLAMYNSGELCVP